MTKTVQSKDGLVMLLGMHRSGTSAMTGVLACLGIELGPKLYGAHEGINDKGYFEHSDIADLNDEVLISLQSSWDDFLPLRPEAWNNNALDCYAKQLRKLILRDFSTSACWAIKDPRVCRLLPWWKGVLDNLGVTPRFIMVFRHPLEVAASLEKRDGFSKEKSLLLWIDHNLQAELHTRGQQRALVDFVQLLSQPRDQIKKFRESLRIEFPSPETDAVRCIEGFLSVDLRRHEAQGLDADGVLDQIASKIHAVLAEAAYQGFQDEHLTRLDQLREQFNEFRAAFPGFLVEHLRAVNSARTESNLTWLKIRRSWSWQLGKPLRYLERRFGRDV